MEIAQVAPYFWPHFGGVESHVLALAQQLNTLGHHITVYTANHAKLSATEDVFGVDVVRVPQLVNLFTTPVAPAFKRHLRRHIRETGTEVVHLHWPPPLTERFASIAARAANVPTVMTYHCDLELPSVIGRFAVSFYLRWLAPRALYQARRVIATTSSYAATSRLIWNVDVEVIPNAVDIQRFHPGLDGTSIREKHGLGDDPFILFTGRLVPHKGHSTIIQALSLLPAPTKLLIIGTGPMRPKLEDMIRRLGLEERVIFVGTVTEEELPLYYAATNVCVLPSIARLEAFGIVGLEAMACGKPVILSDIPGVREVIEDGKQGYICPPMDPEAWAAAIEKLLDYPVRAKKMGERGHRRVIERFSWEKVARQVERVLEAAIAEHPG